MEEKTVDKASNVIIAILFVSIFLAVMLLAVALIVGSVSTANTNLNGVTLTTATATNESNLMNGTIGYFNLTNSGLTNVTCVIPTNGIINASNTIIAHGNWTQQNCRISNATSTFNNQLWSTTYTYTYDTTSTNAYNTALGGIITGVLGLVSNFFSLAPTIGTIFAVVILIGGIVLLVMYVRRMKDQGTSSNVGYAG